MSIIVGAEKKIVFLSVTKPKPVDQATVNVIGFFTAKKNVDEQLITKISDLTGLVQSDALYKKIEVAFGAGAQKVLVKGKLQSGTKNFGDIFDETVNDWFGTVTDETDIAEIAKISQVVTARRKMYIAQLPKATALDGTLASKIGAITQETTALVASKNTDEEDAKIFGYLISKPAGSILLANKYINGAVDSGLTGAEQGVCDKNKVNYVAKMKGQLGVANGVTVTGDPVDFVHGSMAYTFRLEEEITAFLKNNEKPSFDDLGTLKAVIDTVTHQFERQNCLVEGVTKVSFPPIEEMPKNDILNGILTGVIIETKYKYGYKELNATIAFTI